MNFTVEEEQKVFNAKREINEKLSEISQIAQNNNLEFRADLDYNEQTFMDGRVVRDYYLNFAFTKKY